MTMMGGAELLRRQLHANIAQLFQSQDESNRPRISASSHGEIVAHMGYDSDCQEMSCSEGRQELNMRVSEGIESLHPSALLVQALQT